MGRSNRKASRTRAKPAKRPMRPPRLRPDKRRRDPNLFVGTSPSDPPPTPRAWDPLFEEEMFTRPDVDDQGHAKPGRPRIPLDLDSVRALALMHCTDVEIAGFCGVNVRTIERRKLLDPEFRRALDEGRGDGKLSLRRMQIAAAERGDWRAMEWLGRQWLGQRKDPFVESPGASAGKSALLETLDKMEESLREQAGVGPDAGNPTEEEGRGEDLDWLISRRSTGPHHEEVPAEEPSDTPVGSRKAQPS